MCSVRFGSLLMLATVLVACSNHPLKPAPSYVGQPTSARPLVETPPPAVMPVSLAPELKPGGQVSLERLRAEGDTDAALLAAAVADSGATQPLEASPASAPAAAGTATSASTDTDPEHLVGLSEADAIRLLGNPKTRADTPPSRVWTYRSTSCDLRLFFYPEIGGTSYRTLTYEIDNRDPTDTNRRNCVGGLLKNHAS